MAYYSDVIFSSVDLTELENIKIHTVSTETAPETVIAANKLVRRSGAKLFNKEYAGKKITIEGLITASTRNGFISTRDTLMRYLEPVESTLQLPIAAQPRQWTVTVENTIFSNSGGGYGAFTITFLASDPFGYDRDSRTLINGVDATSASNSIDYLEAIKGSYPAAPTYTITLKSIVGGTGAYIDLANAAGDNIRITRTQLNDDVLEIDMLNQTCKANGTAIDYSGTFWQAAIGETAVIISRNFTSGTLHVRASYKPRYL